jgi:tRNA-dihydrouridine synthase
MTAGKTTVTRASFPKDALILAPMAELTHAAFRQLANDYGGWDFFFTEMISVAALMNASPYENYYLDFSPRPEKTVIQLVGNQEDRFLQALEKLKPFPVAGYDINMGCSAPPIRKRGWGVELMKDLEGTLRLIETLRSRLPEQTLSVKMRLGEKEDPEGLLDFCQRLTRAGVDFITLNPRIRKDGRNRPGRWEHVALLARELSIPVLGSGDIHNFSTYSYRVDLASPAGVMLGRGAVVRPWLAALLKGCRENPDFSMEVDLLEGARRFLELLVIHQPREFWLSRARRFFFYYTENMQFGHTLRYAIQNAPDLSTMEILIDQYFKDHPEERLQVRR